MVVLGGDGKNGDGEDDRSGIQGGGGGAGSTNGVDGGQSGSLITKTASSDPYGNVGIRGGGGGDGGYGSATGGGGDAVLKVTGRLQVGGTLYINNGVGVNGANSDQGGAARLTAHALSAQEIQLYKVPLPGGALVFTVDNLEIGSAYDTTLQADGLAAGDATITNLVLTGDKNFMLTGSNPGNVSVGQLIINGGTLNGTNWDNLVGTNLGGYSGQSYKTSL